MPDSRRVPDETETNRAVNRDRPSPANLRTATECAAHLKSKSLACPETAHIAEPTREYLIGRAMLSRGELSGDELGGNANSPYENESRRIHRRAALRGP